MHKSFISCLFWIVLALISLTLAGCTDSQTGSGMASGERVDITQKISPGDDPLTAGEGESLIVWEVQGMTCQGCMDKISRQVAKLDDVQKVRVSLINHTAWVLVDENTLNDAAIASAVEKAGYTVNPVK